MLLPLLTLVKGAGISHVLHLVGIPILSRIYSPSDFGVQALFMAVVGIGSIVATGGYHHAVLAMKEDDDARLMVWGTVSVCGVAAVLLGLAATAAQLGSVALGRDLGLGAFIIVAACLFVVFFGLHWVLRSWVLRAERFRALAVARVVSTTALYGVAVGFGLAGAGYHGLVLGVCVKQLAGAATLLWGAVRSGDDTSRPSFVDVVSLLRRERRFPKFLLPSGVVEKIGQSLHLFLVGAFFGLPQVGQLDMYAKAVAFPASLIGTGVADVFRQRASRALNEQGHCTGLFWKTTLFLAALGLIPALVLFFQGQWVFTFVLGEEWRLAGQFAEVLAPMFFVSSFVSPVGTVLYVGGKQQYDLWTSLYLVLVVTAAMLGARYFGFDVLGVLQAYMLAYVSKYMLEFYLSWRTARGAGA